MAKSFDFTGAPRVIRTPDLRIRRAKTQGWQGREIIKMSL
jgi:hypothetical protein